MTYEQHHDALTAILLSAFHRSDWHMVSDAANDLRVLEAQAADKPDYIRPLQEDA
jgi:hypothetical protein